MECGVQVEESMLVNDQFVGEGFGVYVCSRILVPYVRRKYCDVDVSKVIIFIHDPILCSFLL